MTDDPVLYAQRNSVAILTLNRPDQLNALNFALIGRFMTHLDAIERDDAVRAVIVTGAGERAFSAGADIKEFAHSVAAGVEVALRDFVARGQAFTSRIERFPKPVIGAVNGLAFGGGCEMLEAMPLAVAANTASFAKPEINLGFPPPFGGTQRLPRLIGIDKSVPMIVEGKTVGPAEALKLGMVNEVVPADQLLAAARKAIEAGIDPVRAWDKKGYRVKEGQGLLNPMQGFSYSVLAGKIAAKTWHNYPAPIVNLDAIFEGMLMPFDKALSVESKLFARLMTSPEARNIIRTSFVNKGLADKLVRRPEGIPKVSYKKIGVLGAGLMGSGIAHVAAKVGIDVVLLDSKIEFAEKGKNYSEKIVKKGLDRGTMTQDKADALLAKITPTVDYADLDGCDIVIEAVFEDIEIKADVTRKAEAVLPATAIYASNTSTLPISDLAKASVRPDRFIGLHFFSPVERMPLIEVISGKDTSQETLAQALDLVGQLRMTPVLVNDSRGFYTSRVFQTFIHEGMKLLEEGVDPGIIENAGKIAGMPIGPLELTDALTIELPWKIVKQSIAAEGDKYTLPCAYNVMKTMVEDEKRIGRRGDGGFYDYPAEGGKKIWPGLAKLYPVAPAAEQPDVKDIVRRYLHIQALETARCFEENVLTHAADGDLGSLLGWGFPGYTGGTLSYIDTVGIQQFVADCEAMAQKHGPRFKPSAWLKDRAARNVSFHGPNAG